MAIEKNLRLKMNFYKKHCLPVVIWNKNNLSKQVVPINTHWRKDFSQLLYFLRLVSPLFLVRVKKLKVYFGLYESSLDFQGRDDQITKVYEKKNLFFYFR